MGEFNKKNLAEKERQESAKNFVKRRTQLSGADKSLSKISTIKDINMDTIFKIFGKNLAKGGSVKKKKKFPDLSGDGKVTKKDILMAKGVIKKKKTKKKAKKRG
jgi:translation initiation factor 1 (eIF-1/SUI1)